MLEYETYQQKEPVVCPVCKSTLASRNPEHRLWIHCDDCKADYYFPPFKTSPTNAVPDSFRTHKKCNCGRCGN